MTGAVLCIIGSGRVGGKQNESSGGGTGTSGIALKNSVPLYR